MSWMLIAVGAVLAVVAMHDDWLALQWGRRHDGSITGTIALACLFGGLLIELL